MLGLRFCARAFSSCGKRGPLLITVRGPLTITAPPVAEQGLQTRRLSSCGPLAQSLRGMWDPPRPGLEPVSPALAGRLPTTAPPGKPPFCIFTRHCVRISPVCVFSPLLMPAAHHLAVYRLRSRSSSGLPAAHCCPAPCCGGLPLLPSDWPVGGFLRETYQKWACGIIDQ